MNKSKANEIFNIIKNEYGGKPVCFLKSEDPFQLLTAVILSAQCTDRMVNSVTPALFKRFPDAQAMGGCDLDELMGIIRPTGFYKNKAQNIKKCACALIEKHGGKVPETMEELVELPGVGRKTANVILQNAFGITCGIVVDTHVKRLSNRIGFSKNEDPADIEADVMKLLPQKDWEAYSYYLILHGRAVCDARKPKCGDCCVKSYCDYFKEKGV